MLITETGGFFYYFCAMGNGNITEEKLLQMQAASRLRNFVAETPELKHDFEDVLRQKSLSNIIEGVLFFDGQNIDCVKALFTASGNLRPTHKVRRPAKIKLRNKVEIKKQPPKQIIRWERVMPQLPPTSQKINRPPATYSNKSPYGIATEMLQNQLKTG